MCIFLLCTFLDDKHVLYATTGHRVEETPNELASMYFKSKTHGLLLHHARYPATRGEHGYVYLFHGYKEYHGRYLPFIRKLNEQGYTVFSMDLVGHGRSEGDRGYVQRFRVRQCCTIDSFVAFQTKLMKTGHNFLSW